jgi:hypothetical protein
VTAEIQWLRIQYQQQREQAMEQALQDGLMYQGESVAGCATD